ncbi:hypothetical protein DFH06DRAFT_1472609 [Mycena polygramma]|nr:hypothetical protein DFH06DRAFT_1472609 [Mycena polygramma]
MYFLALPSFPPTAAPLPVYLAGMENNEEPTSFRSLSDNERLIDTLKSGFSDLIKKQEELQKAVELLKPQVPTDKKTTFWTAYMNVADEHDREFKEKYSTDLDGTLIFAGLFSAVSSAFIIQLQPQLESPAGASTVIVAVQGLLYTSLFTALVAALLAVLGKQWVQHYQAAGSRGTIEERGLERQRKLDGLRRWKLDMVLQLFPLLLQLALLLFSGALSLYLWRIHRGIARLVIGLTVFGFGSYSLLLASAILYPDSPFQTPLANFLKQLIPNTLRLLRISVTELRKLAAHTGRLLARFSKPATFSLPSWVPQSATYSNQPLWERGCGAYFQQPLLEVPAIVWLLETSNDPMLVTSAAGMVVDLQWPLDLDLTSVRGRLRDVFMSCFHRNSEAPHVRNGLAHPAIQCGLALGSLLLMERADDIDLRLGHWYGSAQLYYRPVASDETLCPAVQRQLSNVCWMLQVTRSRRSRSIEQFLDQLPAGNMPSLDESTFVSYLCCLNSFFGPVEPRLLATLFKALQGLTDTSLAARIITTTACLTTEFTHMDIGEPESAEISVAAATLARCENPAVFGFYIPESDDDSYPARALQQTTWIFPALEFVECQWQEDSKAGKLKDRDSTTTRALHSLLQFLTVSDPSSLPVLPSIPAVRSIVNALSVPGETSLMAFRTLCGAAQWFCDNQLQPALQTCSVWSKLGQVALEYPDSADYYFRLGEKIAPIPGWKAAIHADLPTWVKAFTMIPWYRYDRDTQFISVIHTIWVRPGMIDLEMIRDSDKKSWILAIAALSQVWETLEHPSSPSEYLRLARCTASTSLRVTWQNYDFKNKPIPHTIRAIFSAQLGRSLVQAAASARNMLPSAASFTGNLHLNRITELLNVMGEKLSNEFEPTRGEVVIGEVAKSYANWQELQKHFDAEIDALEAILGVEHSVPAVALSRNRLHAHFHTGGGNISNF